MCHIRCTAQKRTVIFIFPDPQTQNPKQNKTNICTNSRKHRHKQYSQSHTTENRRNHKKNHNNPINERYLKS